MAEADFEGSWEAYRDLLEFIKAHGCYFMKGSLVKEEAQIFAQPKITSEDDVAPGNHLWYVFSDKWTIEPMETRLVNNIYQGEMFSVIRTDGGPYLEIYAFKRKDPSMHINVVCKPSYWLSTGPVRAPQELKDFYKQVKKFLKSKGCRLARV